MVRQNERRLNDKKRRGGRLMGREIKFRVWDGNIYHYSDLMIPRRVGGKGPNHYLLYEKYEYQQFTGLLDKNGKEIYDGDISCYEPEEGDYYSMHNGQKDCLISWRDDKHSYGWLVSSEKGGFDWNLRRKLCDSLIVIGNIFENPELLK